MTVVPAILNYSNIADYTGGDWLVSLPDKDHITLLNLISVIAANPDRYFQDWEGNELDIYDLCDSIIGKLLSPMPITTSASLLQIIPSTVFDQSGNSLNHTVTTLAYLNGYYVSAASIDNSYWRWRVALGKGTYTCKLMGLKSNVAGKYEMRLNGVSAGIVDAYNAATLYNQTFTFGTNIAIASDGEYDLDVRVNGKNASSGGFFVGLQLIELVKVAGS